jgi:hypothetical protein
VPKFEIEFELQGLKLKVKGERDDISKITSALNQQLSGLLPSPEMADGAFPEHRGFQDAKDVTPQDLAKPAKRKRAKGNSSGSTSSGSGDTAVTALDWRHSPEKWGAPSQTWTTADKSTWILYVVQKELNVAEMSTKQISITFNKHFRQAGAIRPQNVSRDLGLKKLKSPSEVGQDTTKPGEPWFLTETGIHVAENLIKSCIGKSEA